MCNVSLPTSWSKTNLHEQVEEISTIQATPMQQVADLSSNPYFQPQNTVDYGNNLKHIQTDLKTKLIQNYNQIKTKLQRTKL